MLLSKEEVIEGVKRACDILGGKFISNGPYVKCDFGERTKGEIIAFFEDEQPTFIVAKLLYDNAVVRASVDKPLGIRCPSEAECFFFGEELEEGFSIKKVKDKIEIFKPSRAIFPL